MSPEATIAVAFGTLIVGWVLGAFTPTVQRWIDRPRQIKSLKTALAVELKELRFTLVMVVHAMRNHLGTLDRDCLVWMTPFLEAYDGPDAPSPAVKAYLRKLADVSDEAVAAPPADPSPLGFGLALKTYALPLLDSHIVNLQTLPFPLQRALLDVRTKLDLFNQQTTLLIRERDHTFTATGANHEIATQNLKNGYADLGSRARFVADLISKVLADLELESH